METFSIHKGATIAPLKARMTLDLIRGKKVSQAEAILLTTNTKASRLIIKVLNSAVSNAVNNFGAKKEDLADHGVVAVAIFVLQMIISAFITVKTSGRKIYQVVAGAADYRNVSGIFCA